MPTARCCSPPPSAGWAGEYEKRAAALVADKDEHFTLRTDAGAAGRDLLARAMRWPGSARARICSARVVQLDRRIDRVSDKGREAVILRLKDWLRSGAEAVLGPLRAAGHAAQDPAAPPAVRALLALLVDEGGIVARDAVAGALAALDKDQRRAVTGLGVRIGALDLFMPAVLKPEAMRWRAALRAAAANRPMPDLPPANAVVLADAARSRPARPARLPRRRAADDPRRHGRAHRPPRP